MADESAISVLIIDDEDALRNAMNRILELEGFATTTASNGMEGIARGAAKEFDLALIDLKMPDLNGIEVLKEIRKQHPNTVCFIVTAYASYETAVEAAKHGADGYILKPFTPEELNQQLTIGIKKRKLLQETARLKKEREESLLEVTFERTRLKVIINSISEGVLVINKKGELVYCNPAALRLLDINYLPIGLPVGEHLPTEMREMIWNNFLSVENQDSAFSDVVTIKPENELIVEAAYTPVKQGDNTLAGVVLVIKDVTEFKKLEALKSQFVSMVAHELKAPLAASLGFIDIINDPKISVTAEQQKDFLGRTSARLKGLLQMVNDLLDISRIEMNTFAREIKDVCIEDVIADVLYLFKNEIEKMKLTVAGVSNDEKHIIRVDQNEFARMMTNLISNAIKYNKQNGSIQVDVHTGQSYTVIRIADSGIGMKPAEREKLFNEFFRAKNEFTKSVHGTGLGLSIVKRIAEVYSGKIECESIYGTGTTFTLYFPLTGN